MYSFLINNQPLKVIDDTTRLASTTIRIANSFTRLAAAIQEQYPSSQIQINARRVTQLPNQLDFNILYHGVDNPPTVTIDTTGVTGGVDNVIDAIFSDKRPYAGDRPYFYGIPNDFLRSAENKPSIEIKYNQIPALCSDCTYTYQSIPQFSVSSASFVGTPITGLTFTLAYNSGAVIFDRIADVTISLYGQICQVLT